jgi:hypothetical protein
MDAVESSLDRGAIACRDDGGRLPLLECGLKHQWKETGTTERGNQSRDEG